MPLEVEMHANAKNCVTTLRTNTGKIQGSISACTDPFQDYLVLTMFSSPDSQTSESSQSCSSQESSSPQSIVRPSYEFIGVLTQVVANLLLLLSNF